METGEDVLASAESDSGCRGVFSANESQSRAVRDPVSIESPEKEGASSKRRRKVSFPDDNRLVHSLEPFDPWENVVDYTSKEVIDAYRSICQQLNAKACEKLVKQLEACESFKERIDVIDLRGTKLDLKSCETLEEVLRRVRTKTLDLENTNLEDEGTLSILEMVEFYHSACKLNLAYNSKIRLRGWQALSRAIKRTPCLEYLDVRHTVWTEQSIPFIGRSLRLNCPLTILHMEATNLSGRPLFLLGAAVEVERSYNFRIVSGEGFKYDFVKVFLSYANKVFGYSHQVNAIKGNQNLRDLFLGDNKLVPSDGQCIGSMLKVNETLRLLDLRNNSLQDMGLDHISEGLTHQTNGGLQTLVLWNNQLTFHSMGHLGAALVPLKTLQTLNLGHNRLTNEGIHKLKDGLLLNNSLQRLGLLNTRLTSEGIIALAEVIADSKTMLRLDIRENDPYVGGLMALALSLKMNYSLVRIDLDKELKKEPGMETTQRILLADIYSYCQRNKAIVEEKEASVTSLAAQDVMRATTTATTETDCGTVTKERSSTEEQPLIQIDSSLNMSPNLNNISKDLHPASSRFKITRIYEGSQAGIPETSSGEESTSSEGEGLLVEIEPNSPEGISNDLENFEIFDVESDSSSSQDAESDNRVDSYHACGSKESLDSMGTPITRTQGPSAAFKLEHPAHNFERELDAMLASVNDSQRPAPVKNELPNDNEYWLQHMDGIFKPTSNSCNSPTNSPTGDLLGS